MPIKEIMTWTMLVLAGWYMTGGPKGTATKMRKAEIAILREVTRTNTWGDPSLFHHARRIRK
jgi:hypothetical protein